MLNDGFSRMNGTEIYRRLGDARDDFLLALNVMRQASRNTPLRPPPLRACTGRLAHQRLEPGMACGWRAGSSRATQLPGNPRGHGRGSVGHLARAPKQLGASCPVAAYTVVGLAVGE